MFDTFVREFVGSPRGTGPSLVDVDRRFTDLVPGPVTVIGTDPNGTEIDLFADPAVHGSLPASTYGTVLVTRLLDAEHLDATLANLWQSLCPGGLLVLATRSLPDSEPPPYSHEPPGAFFRRGAIEAAVHRLSPPPDEQLVRERGGFVTALAHLGGIAADELRPAELSADDPRYAVAVLCRLVKAATAAGHEGPTAAASDSGG